MSNKSNNLFFFKWKSNPILRLHWQRRPPPLLPLLQQQFVACKVGECNDCWYLNLHPDRCHLPNRFRPQPEKVNVQKLAQPSTEPNLKAFELRGDGRIRRGNDRCGEDGVTVDGGIDSGSQRSHLYHIRSEKSQSFFCIFELNSRAFTFLVQEYQFLYKNLSCFTV